MDRLWVDLGGMTTVSPLGRWKSAASCPANIAWYVSGLLLGLDSRTYGRQTVNVTDELMGETYIRN